MAQPNMGPRKLVALRPPADVARAFELELANTGMTCSELLADIAAARYALPLPSKRVRTKRRVAAAQEELPGQAPSQSVPREPREHYGTRLPVDVYLALGDEAKPAALPYGVLLCDILAERYDLPPVSRRIRQTPSTHSAQGVLVLAPAEEVPPLSRAS